jgi:thiol:disulfide interchange protein DsbC
MKTELFKRMFFKGISKLLEETEEMKLIRTRFNKLLGVGADTIEKTDSEHIYLVTKKSNNEIVYVTKDSNFVLTGDMFRINDDGTIVNLTEVAKKEKRKEIINNLNIEDMIVYNTNVSNPYVIYVFTDVDCGHCRELHEEIPRLNELGIEVRYLALPRRGIDSDTRLKMVSAWCSIDKRNSMNILMKGEKIELNKCDDNPVEEQFYLATPLGIEGTPGIILPDGELLSGYFSAKELAEKLGITPN